MSGFLSDLLNTTISRYNMLQLSIDNLKKVVNHHYVYNNTTTTDAHTGRQPVLCKIHTN